MNNTQTIIDLITGFVVKAGGIHKVEQVIASMKVIKDRNDITGFIQRVGKRPEGAQQLFAAALLGFTLAAMTFDAEQQRQAKGN